MNLKLIGGILLIVGTSIGGGMLALPVAVASGGFWASTAVLLACWLLMTFCAFLILEVNLWLPRDSNMVSMARATLGKSGQALAWLSYLFLHYCLLAAYTAGGTDILHSLLQAAGIQSPLWISSLLFVSSLGFIVYQGIQSNDYVNRGLMFAKLAAYLVLVACILPFVQITQLGNGQPILLLGTVTVMITSFGFAAIVPSLRSYYQDDVKQLRQIILIGSFIPLVCYICWNLAILGTLPKAGDHGLMQMLKSGHSNSDIILALQDNLHNAWITRFARAFTSICVATSFLGVALCLTDFLADGLRTAHRDKHHPISIYLLAFLPPLTVVIFYPSAFIAGLSYAGIFCTLLLVFLPCLMAWHGRYRLNLTGNYCVSGGAWLIVLAGTAGLGIVLLGLAQNFKLI
jgi:tyrosine-specific transport protein